MFINKSEAEEYAKTKLETLSDNEYFTRNDNYYLKKSITKYVDGLMTETKSIKNINMISDGTNFKYCETMSTKHRPFVSLFNIHFDKIVIYKLGNNDTVTISNRGTGSNDVGLFEYRNDLRTFLLNIENVLLKETNNEYEVKYSTDNYSHILKYDKSNLYFPVERAVLSEKSEEHIKYNKFKSVDSFFYPAELEFSYYRIHPMDKKIFKYCTQVWELMSAEFNKDKDVFYFDEKIPSKCVVNDLRFNKKYSIDAKEDYINIIDWILNHD